MDIPLVLTSPGPVPVERLEGVPLSGKDRALEYCSAVYVN